MTAIEFYDRTPVENVISALTTQPDKIVFVGENSQMRNFNAIYARFLQERGLSIAVSYRGINRHDVNSIAQVLASIVEEEEECLFDLTGGDDLTLVAMGIVYQRYKDTRRIQMQRCNVYNGRVTDCDNDGNTVYTGVPTLTVDELIRLHGGAVRYGNDYTYQWNLTDEFVADVDLMWTICREDPNLWNICLTALSKASTREESDDFAVVSLPRLEGYLQEMSTPMEALHTLLLRLERVGLIRHGCTDGNTLSFAYKDEQIRQCLVKAGTVLEMKVLVTARRVTEKDGTPFYTDAVNGVYIDWDGQLHDRYDEQKDTGNEIEGVRMKGLAPVFVSCKNGQVEDDELYKLSAVTDRFGSLYAKKVLIATQINKGVDSMRYFRQRTKDMGIRLVEGVHLLEEPEFEAMIRRLMQS